MPDDTTDQRPAQPQPASRERLAPVGNRGTDEHAATESAKVYPGGDRGADSGVHQDQKDAVSGTPD